MRVSITIFFISILSFLAMAFTPVVAMPAKPDASDRILIVISSYGLDEGKTRPGFEMDELSQAYAVFADNGLDIDIASPAGGIAVADEFDPKKPYNQRLLNDSVASAKLKATRKLTSVRDQKYAAIFVIGGKGAMFDLPVNIDLKALLAETYEAGGVVGAVCHGPAAFMNVPLKNGGSLIAGRAVTGFSNEEEILFGKRWLPAFPVLLADGLSGSGARFSAAPMMLSHVVTDGRIVTGQNPYSTTQTAEAMVEAMGRKVAARQTFADERSITLIGQVLAGEGALARKALAANPAHYDVPLIAIWGFYRAQSPRADRKILTSAVEVMELASPHFAEPQLVAAIADARSKLANLP